MSTELTLVHQRVHAARCGANPTVVCRLTSGWFVLADQQFLPGYSLLLPDPVVPSLNDLSEEMRKTFLLDMTLIGDALLFVTGATRINYEILGNQVPALHAHIIPRYAAEPAPMNQGSAFAYPPEQQASRPFEHLRDADLIKKLGKALFSRVR